MLLKCQVVFGNYNVTFAFDWSNCVYNILSYTTIKRGSLVVRCKENGQTRYGQFMTEILKGEGTI